jgi:hypothetical protein
MIYENLTRIAVSPSSAATFGSAADVRPKGDTAVFAGSLAWSPPM